MGFEVVLNVNRLGLVVAHGQPKVAIGGVEVDFPVIEAVVGQWILPYQ